MFENKQIEGAQRKARQREPTSACRGISVVVLHIDSQSARLDENSNSRQYARQRGALANMVKGNNFPTRRA
jgi:hypothetical protein